MCITMYDDMNDKGKSRKGIKIKMNWVKGEKEMLKHH